MRLVAKAANLKSQRVWLSASCLFNNNDGKLNVNTPHPRKKGFICVEIYLTPLEIVFSFDTIFVYYLLTEEMSSG